MSKYFFYEVQPFKISNYKKVLCHFYSILQNSLAIVIAIMYILFQNQCNMPFNKVNFALVQSSIKLVLIIIILLKRK